MNDQTSDAQISDAILGQLDGLTDASGPSPDNSREQRELRFDSLDAVVAEAERLASGKVRTTGSHSFGQILEHLARTHDMTTGELLAPQPPWYMRLMIPLMKPILLKDKPLKPGFNLPKKAEGVFWPDQEFEEQEALAHLKRSVETYKQKGPMPKHPMFGKITRQQNDRLNCNHAALHLSFVHPEQDPTK